MNSIASVTGGVDTHLDVHVAAALDERGGLVGTGSFPTTAAGYRSLVGWLRGFGRSPGSGSRAPAATGRAWSGICTRRGVAVVEIDRPNRQMRRQKRKSDTLDAISAAGGAQRRRDRCGEDQRRKR